MEEAKKDKKKKKKKHKHRHRSSQGSEDGEQSEDDEERRERKARKKLKKEAKEAAKEAKQGKGSEISDEEKKIEEIVEIREEPEDAKVEAAQPEVIVPKREMKVNDLSQVKFRQYKCHDAYEKKQQQLIQSGAVFNIMNESANNFFGNVTPQLCGVKSRDIKQYKL